ncbi:type II secretion system protein G [Limihaloglobus sulfuriphilus]|uniref:Type II secretion system protein G n=1 Tax=Limihaloglobus sulfuriphilus TaxID=1851148 RepID=A0A1Q2MD95_9BACT|nr:type II secretion system protein [Limihaloglobus sulfuriphilus]AQQ70232.1 type II secretion system protein G [Limihaloglobus sulfuriphilus]
MNRKKAFTLIELLVVISIIALLMSILMPALSRVRKQAKRTVCGSNLHNWGLAVNAYYSDNDYKIPSSRTSRGSRGGAVEVPCHMLVFSVKGSPWEHQMSMEKMDPYLPGFDVNTREMSPAWICPESQVDTSKVFDQYKQLQDLEPEQRTPYARAWFPVCYSYFARVDLWRDNTTEPEELTARNLSGDKLLMADAVYRWHNGGAWWYNHSKGRSSVHQDKWGDNVEVGVPDIAGTNQLFGDGSVIWKNGSEFEPELMNECSPDVAQVHANSNSPTTSRDTVFW